MRGRALRRRMRVLRGSEVWLSGGCFMVGKGALHGVGGFLGTYKTRDEFYVYATIFQ